MALKIVSLEVKDPRINFNKKYTFDSEIIVSQSEAAFILHNLLNFTSIPYSNPMESIAEIDINGDILKIHKLYLTGEIKYSINGQDQSGDIYSWISDKLKIVVNQAIWQGRFIDFKNLEIKSSEDLLNLFKDKDAALRLNPGVVQEKEKLNAQLEQLKSESLKGLTEEQVKKVDRLRDVKFRINKIQKEVDDYQGKRDSKEDLEKKIKDAELKFNTINDKLSSVSSLISSRDNILKELKKYDSSWAENVTSLKEEKNIRTNEFLQTAYTKPVNRVLPEDVEPHLNFNKVFLFIQIPLTLVLAIVLYLLTQLDLILVIGFLFILLEFGFTLFEVFRKNREENLNLHTLQELPQKKNLDHDSSKDHLFINQAWMNAYQGEINRIDQLITSNLSGEKYSEFELKKRESEIELNKLNRELAVLRTNEMDSEVYYKKRRELDILKIEKENIEFGGGVQINNEAELEALTLKVDELEDVIDNVEEARSQIPLIAINVKESIKQLISNLSNLRQIILINNAK